jgi:hypothetical protein
VDGSNRAEPPQIGAALDTVRAAIDVVASGGATRVTVQVPEATRLLPAAVQLARRAGVRVELVEPVEPDAGLTFLPFALAAGH